MADNNIDPDLIRDLNEKYREMRDAIATMVPAMVLSTTAINQMIAASKGLAVSEKDGTKVVDEFLKSVKQSTVQNEEEVKAKKKKADADVAMAKIDAEMRQSLKQFGTALLSNTAGMAKYGQAVTTTTNAVAEFASGFGIFGKLLGGVVKILGIFAAAVFQQNDQMNKAYDSLSEVGATSALTTNDIRKLGSSAGYVGERLEIFTDITKGLGSNLIAMGGSASKGTKAFAALATVSQEQRDSMYNLGISQEQYTKLQATYIRQTTESGMRLSKSTETQRKEADKYIVSLVELASLTGISLQKQQEALDIANADENFNQYKAAQSMKREDLLEQAKKEQDQGRKKELTAQADSIKATLDAKDSYAKVAVSTMSAANAAAVLQSIATDGATVYTESNAKLLMAGIDVAKHNQEMNAGRSQEVALLEGQVKAVRRFTNMFGNGANAYGEYSKELQKIFGVDNKMRLTAAQFKMLEKDEGIKNFLAQKKLNAEEIAAKKAGIGPIDEARKLQAEMNAKELAFKKTLDDLVNQISGPVNSGFTILLQTVMGLGKTFANLAYEFSGGKIDLRHFFKTPEEFKQDVADITKEIARLEPIFAKEVKLREDKLKVDQEIDEKEKKLATANIEEKSKLQLEIRKLQNDSTKLQQEIIKSGGIKNPTGPALEKKRQELKDTRKNAAAMGINLDVPTVGEDPLAKVRFKDPKENRGGGKADPALEALALKINDAFPNSTITAMNDIFHQNQKDANGQLIKSKHTEGKALDFTLNPAPANAEEAAVIKAAIKRLGPSKVLDEYFESKTDQTRGGHFHVEVARNGGMFKGPDTGYPVILHGDELITPMNKVQNVTKTELSSLPMLDSGVGSRPGSATLIKVIALLTDKLDKMIDTLEDSVDIQDKILTEARN
jgi:hypothetical protein